MRGSLTAESFEPHLGSAFRLEQAQVSMELRLEEVQRRARRAAPREPFSLLFLGPQAPVLPQRIYRLEHARLGTLEIFIVPIGLGSEGVIYEAVFN